MFVVFQRILLLIPLYEALASKEFHNPNYDLCSCFMVLQIAIINPILCLSEKQYA